MKTFKLFSFLMLISICSMTFVSCEKKEEAKDSTQGNSAIVGQWLYQEADESSYWGFTADGKYEYDYEDAVYEEMSVGTYSVSGSTINLESFNGQTQSVSFSVSGNTLTINGVPHTKL